MPACRNSLARGPSSDVLYGESDVYCPPIAVYCAPYLGAGVCVCLCVWSCLALKNLPPPPQPSSCTCLLFSPPKRQQKGLLKDMGSIPQHEKRRKTLTLLLLLRDRNKIHLKVKITALKEQSFYL